MTTDVLSAKLASYMAQQIGHGMSEKTEPFAKMAVEFFAQQALSLPITVEPGEMVAYTAPHSVERLGRDKDPFSIVVAKSQIGHLTVPLYARPQGMEVTDDIKCPRCGAPVSRDKFDAHVDHHISIAIDLSGITPGERAWMRNYELSLNRRADVENVLIAVANGKRDPLTPDECRDLAAKLGTAELTTIRDRANGAQ